MLCEIRPTTRAFETDIHGLYRQTRWQLQLSRCCVKRDNNGPQGPFSIDSSICHQGTEHPARGLAMPARVVRQGCPPAGGLRPATPAQGAQASPETTPLPPQQPAQGAGSAAAPWWAGASSTPVLAPLQRQQEDERQQQHRLGDRISSAWRVRPWLAAALCRT